MAQDVVTLQTGLPRAYLARYGTAPSRNLALVLMDGDTPVVILQVTY